MLTQLLGTGLPIIQAPMAGVQDATLAAAVCNAGGLGSLPCAMLSPEDLQREIARLKGLTDRPFNLNFFCHTPVDPTAQQLAQWKITLMDYFRELGVEPPESHPGPAREPFGEETLAIVESVNPAVVSFHFGLPGPDWVERIKSRGSRILSTATTVEEAVWLADNGADAIIAQGLEAGGHRGSFLSEDMNAQSGTLSLLPQVCEKVSVPVIAAGGIAGPQGVAAAIALGAAGVQVGTAFLLCPEALTSPLHRAALSRTGAGQTALTNVFTGRPARSIVNRLVREIGPMARAVPPFPAAAALVSALRRAAEPAGNPDFTPLWCGQNASGCSDISAVEILRRLAEGLPAGC
ncbi:MAG: nitronate monooxygenase [Halieaceae bacterium]|nr:nitronate monooxygenase [Halieaceae bacterium]